MKKSFYGTLPLLTGFLLSGAVLSQAAETRQLWTCTGHCLYLGQGLDWDVSSVRKGEALLDRDVSRDEAREQAWNALQRECAFFGGAQETQVVRVSKLTVHDTFERRTTRGYTGWWIPYTRTTYDRSVNRGVIAEPLTAQTACRMRAVDRFTSLPYPGSRPGQN